MGMPEYSEFFDLCERFDDVRMDTTMVFTSFTEELMPFPQRELPRLRHLGDHTLPGVGDDWLRRVLYDNSAELFGCL